MRRFLLVSVTVLGACASPPNYSCSSPTDLGDRGIALCSHGTDNPVCDSPGMTAHYEENPMGGYSLVGGTTADCDVNNQVVCPDRTETPRCIAQPVEP